MTEHIEAKLEDIADIVIMPGDPLRAKMIAEKYLKDYKLVNKVRNNYAYTGYFNGKLVTIMSSGMGMGSIGIYSYELFKIYNVKRIIRIGTCGSYTNDLKVYDTILATSVYTDSNFEFVQTGTENNILQGFSALNDKLIQSSKELGIDLKTGVIHSSDVFYRQTNNYKQIYEKYNCKAVEMESYALLATAHLLNKEAACLLTVSNSFVDDSTTTSEERQNKFFDMIEIALNTL